MAKFIFSNKPLEAVVGKSCGNGFSVSGKTGVNDTEFVSFHKLCIDNVNYLEVGESGFISVIGTWIYNGSIGEDALYNIYNDFNGAGSIPILRDTVIGNCAFIIKKEDRVYVFGDNYSLFNVFYIVRNDEFVISNNLMDIANLIDVEPDWNNVYERLCFESIYCGGTILKDVYRLTDDKYLVYNSKDKSLTVKDVNVVWSETDNEKLSYENIVTHVSNALSEDAAAIEKCYGIPALSSTGGLDNRMNLAAFLSSGSKPDLYYGVGNSSVTNTYNEDAEIDKLYAERFGLKLQLNSWTTPNPINRDWESLLEKYGFDYMLYSGSADTFASYVNIQNKAIFFGYYGEIYRNLDFINNLQKGFFTIDEYIDDYLYRLFDPHEILIPAELDFRTHVRGHLLQICEKWNIDPNHISKEQEVYLSLERRSEGDTWLINWINLHHYSCLLMAQKRSLKYVIGVETKRKEHSKFMLDLLNHLDAQVLDVPIFTHQKYMKYDKETNSLVEPEVRKNLYATIKENLPSNALITMLKRSKLGAAIRNKLLSQKKAEERRNDSHATAIIDDIMKHYGKRKGVDYGGHGFGGMIQKTIQYSMLLIAFDKAKVFK